MIPPGQTLPPGTPLSPTTPPSLHLEQLSLRYDGTVLFEDLGLVAEAGRFTVLLGPSGVGKSSLLKIAAGLVSPQTGRVRAGDNRPISGRVAFMGQQDLLFPWATVLDNVMIGARLRGDAPDRARALELLDQVGLRNRAASLPDTLSGGMRQRAALARTLYEDRPFVLMDEPFSALDAASRARMQALAASLLRGRTVLMITHDPLEACRLGDALLVLSGRPAVLDEPIAVPGNAPRPPDDADVLHLQAILLRRLMR